MKFRLFTLIMVLALSLGGWTQDTPAASPAPNSTPAPQAQTCGHHDMAGMKDGKGCCHHAAADADAKDASACCGKKCEAKGSKSCREGKKMKAAMKECKKNGCCTDGNCCGDAKSCGKDKSEKTAKGCCGNKCERPAQTPAVS
jgi:hypothetical protein